MVHRHCWRSVQRATLKAHWVTLDKTAQYTWTPFPDGISNQENATTICI